MAIFFRFLLIISVFIPPLSAQSAAGGLSPVVKSLVLPGMGEFQLGQAKRGRTFLLTESILWLSVLTCSQAAKYQDETIRSIAADHAGVDVRGKDDQYWVDIGNYVSLDEFNAEHQRWRDVDDLYNSGSEWNWSWDSKTNQKEFEARRINRDRWALSGKFLLGGIVINHVVSAIDALYLKRKLAQHEVSIRPSFSPDSQSVQVALSYTF